MAELFPSGLQDKLNADSFTHAIGETAIRSNMDVGPSKVRRRSTKGIDSFGCTIDLTYSDYQLLYDWFNTTLAGGTKNFLFDHPFTGVEKEFRFVGGITISPLNGGIYFKVQMRWELMN